MTEKLIQEGIQDVIQSMDEFADADVVINDYSLFDLSSLSAPYVIIENSDDVETTQDGHIPVTIWSIKLILIERFVDWTTTQDNLRDRRQAIFDKFNAGGSERSAGIGGGVDIMRIRTSSPILEWYSPDLPENQRPGTTPVFLFQFITLVTKEF